MFFRLFAFLAFVAVVFANPKPDPQVLTYTAPAVAAAYGYPAGYAPLTYSAGYPAYPYGYSAYYYR